MSDDVAEVIADALAEAFDGIDLTETDDDSGWWETSTGAEFGARKLREAPDALLDALTTAGYAVVRLPEGVAVAHGARLVYRMSWIYSPLYSIEDTP